MPGNPARLTTPARAYAAGLRAQLLGQSPYRQWQREQALAAAPDEVAAAYRAGASAPLSDPLPSDSQLMAAVVMQMARMPPERLHMEMFGWAPGPCEEPTGTTAGADCRSAPQLGHNRTAP